MRLSKLLFAPVICALSTAHIANAGEAVDFAFKESELSTQERRELLLDRIQSFSTQSCSSVSVLVTRYAAERCATDLKQQLVNAIDNDALTMLAEARAEKTYRSASR